MEPSNHIQSKRADENETIHVIIEYTEDDSREEQIGHIGKIIHRLPIINAYVIEINQSDFHKLEGVKGVKAVHQNAHIAAQMNVARKTVKADSAQSEGYLGRGITIAILDTGIAPIEDFTSPRNRIVAFHDVIQKRTQPYDDNGHGTQEDHS